MGARLVRPQKWYIGGSSRSSGRRSATRLYTPVRDRPIEIESSNNRYRHDRRLWQSYPDIQLSVGNYAIKTMERARGIQRQILEEMGISNANTRDPTDPAFAAHHIGTTRMGTNPEESVVTL